MSSELGGKDEIEEKVESEKYGSVEESMGVGSAVEGRVRDQSTSAVTLRASGAVW